MTASGIASKSHRAVTRAAFNEAYDRLILGGGFCESDSYYVHDRERYFQTLRFFARLSLPRPASVLEIGGGQLAIISKALFGDDGTVGDITDAYRLPVERAGCRFEVCNLLDANSGPSLTYDVLALLEVIEHLPVPPYTVFQRLRAWLKPGGILVLTTPNLFRLRNLIRMALGREYLDRFELPEPGRGLGHQHEYSADHMSWQLERAGFEVIFLVHDQLGQIGHSTSARLARRLLAPLLINPHWRDELVIAARPKA